MSTKDYYQLLGVEPDASSRSIRVAYRKALRHHHPDANAGKRDGEQLLLQVIAAGRVLRNPRQRAEYDRQRTKSRVQPPADKPAAKSQSRLVNAQRMLLGWQKILQAVNLSCKRFFSAEQARHTEFRAAQTPEPKPPDFNFYLNRANSRKGLHRYQRGADGIYRKVTREFRDEKLKSWQKRTALWLLIGIMLWRI